jgi:hypothetical protein
MRYLPRSEAGEIKDKTALRVIGMFEYKGKACVVTRDRWGKFRVVVDDRSVQHNLSAEEIVRYMANMMNDERNK